MFLTFCIGCVCASEFLSYEHSNIQDNPVLSSCFGADGDQNYYLSVFHEYIKFNIPDFSNFPNLCIYYNALK